MPIHKVQIVGAGPGALDLLTLRAIRALEQAEIVLYDRLVQPAVLDLAKKAECIYVGKEPQQSSKERQDRICRLLIEYAKKGKKTLRLKGGDPFVFGRGGEEALALSQAGVPFEIIPGITSPVAAPSAAWIPVTHRGIASSFAVFSGQSANPLKSGIDWEIAARIPTAVFLMGVNRLPMIVRELIAHGRHPETPIGIIEKGTLPEQQVYIGTLSDILERIDEISAPSTIVVGEVVLLREQMEIAFAAAQPYTAHESFGDEQPQSIQLPDVSIDYTRN